MNGKDEPGVSRQQQTRVAEFSLGGTIAMTLRPQGGVALALSAADLLAAVPGIAEARQWAPWRARAMTSSVVSGAFGW
jgi:L-asparaginase/Glu-tRNA(Gln) amidotransferase subunit D